MKPKNGNVMKLLEAMCEVECGRSVKKAMKDGPAGKIPFGDDGDSRGPLQIQVSFFIDATEWAEKNGIESAHEAFTYQPTYGHDSSDVDSWPGAMAITLFYWNRYAFKALYDGDLETLARIHNGGPRGHRKKATIPYWERVKAVMKKNGYDYEGEC